MMKFATFLMTARLSLVFASGALASTFGSVEPIANPAVLDTSLLRRQPLGVRKHLHGSSCSAASWTR